MRRGQDIVPQLNYGPAPFRIPRLNKPYMRECAGVSQWASRQAAHDIWMRPPAIPRAPWGARTISGVMQRTAAGPASFVRIPAIFVPSSIG
jgi:hypothetical protein